MRTDVRPAGLGHATDRLIAQPSTSDRMRQRTSGTTSASTLGLLRREVREHDPIWQ